MGFLADGLLIAAAMTSALYCYVLARRLAALKDTGSGLGGAIAALTERVDLTRNSLAETRTTTTGMMQELQTATERAEVVASRLERLLAEIDGTPRGASEDPPPPRQNREETERDLLDALQNIAAGGARP